MSALYALKYKTRGNASPRGKRRVYYTAHGEDREKFLEEISGDILRLQDCAIWYDCGEGEEVDAQMREHDLADMNLFVIPVTSRLLEDTECQTVRDFKYAVEHHIPVLTLMQESGLDDEFNRVFGDIQYLDKYAEDPTAITFEEKLSRFLSSVLIGDELVEKVRAAFDAYIFLSYRKKDRKYARELMRLIHQNEFCRDIAIWYDEFLTPGENFNGEIASALEKSRIFALAITPNLVNEQNYVMQVEYPMAKKAGKPILPAELVKTSKKGLKEGFSDIPDPVDAQDGVALSDALMKTLGEIAIRENDNSPEHNFFIGLAYLSGIDVEVDHERAVRLITSSADGGLMEAVEKLTQMYRDGEGVFRDRETSLKWQMRLVEMKKREAETGDEDAVVRYLSELNDLAYRMYSMSRLEESISAYRHLENETERFSHRLSEWRVLGYTENANKWIGTIQYSEGHIKEAEASLKRAIVLCERYAEFGEREKDNLAECYSALGHAYRSVSRLNEAKEQYVLSFGIRSKLASGNSTVRTQYSLAVAYDDLGLIENMLGNFKAAIEYYLKALAIFETVAETVPSAQYKNSIYICSDRIADAYAETDREIARKYYSQACEVCREVADMTGSNRDICSLAGAYASYANNEEYLGNTDLASEYYLLAIEIYEQIADKASGITVLHNRAAAYSRYGDLCRRKGDLENAEKYLLLSLEIREKFDECGGVMQVRLGKASIYARLGMLYRQKGMLDEAKKSYRSALDIYSMVAEDGGVGAKISIGSVKKDLAFVYKEEGDTFKAIKLMEEAVAIAERERNTRGTLEAKRTYALTVENYAHMLLDIMREQAVKKYVESVDCFEELAKESGARSDAKTVLRLSAWLASEYERRGDTENAIREYERVNSVYGKDGECYCDLETDLERAKRYVALGRLYLTQGEVDLTLSIVHGAIEILENANVEDDLLCEARVIYGDACADADEPKTASEWYNLAIQDYLILCMKTQDAEYYYSISTVYRRKADLYTGFRRRFWLKRAYKAAKLLATKFSERAEYTEWFKTLSAEISKK